MKQKQTHTEYRLVVAKASRRRGGGWIGSQGLADENYWKKNIFPGKYIHYPGINHNGKEYEKECIYMYKLNHFAVQRKFTLHCKSTILK